MKHEDPNENAPLLESSTKTKSQLFRESFKQLMKSPRDLWMIYTSKFITLCGFGIAVVGLPIYLSEVQDLSDVMIGFFFAGAGAAAFVFAFFLSGFADKYGVRLAIIVSNFLGIIVFGVLSIFTIVAVQLAVIIIFLMSSMAISLPACKLAVKKYTVPEARSIGYSVLFVLLFAGGVFSALALDLALSLGSEDFETFRYLYISALALQVVGFVVGCFIRNLDYEYSGEVEVQAHADVNLVTHTTSLLGSKEFWRFIVVVLMMVISQMVYMQVKLTLPLFMDRDIEEDAHFGLMLAFHEVLTMLCTPLMTFLVYYFSNYSLLILGGVVCAAAPLAFLIGSSYFTVTLFLVGVSIGQAIHGPRLVEYTMQIAPVGKEAGFLGITATPIAASIIIGGVLAGPMLDEYCPEDGEKQCWAMWLVYSVVAFLSPILLFALRSVLEQFPTTAQEGDQNQDQKEDEGPVSEEKPAEV